MIKVENVNKIYKIGTTECHALRDINFTVKAGEFVAIMGPSGSGKSTLMHILGALDNPTTGKYFLDNKDVSKLSDDQLSDIRSEKIGFVFQSFNLLPRTSVLRNTIMPLLYSEVIPKEEREKKAKDALLSAGLSEEFYKNFSNQLSGGQIQRVAIARALINNPKLILADEPTGNLDTKTGDIVLGTFQKLNKEQGRTIILITHEKEVAEHAHRIIHIKDGSIISDSQDHTRRVIK